MFSSLAIDRSRRFGSSWILLLVTVAALALLAGCGGGEKATEGEDALEEVTVIATVGGEEITADYYEERLVKIQANELPSKDGQYLDMSSLEGKLAFLDVLINKELMVLKAKQLGYDQESQVVAARDAMMEYEAIQVMWQDFAEGLGNEISTEQVQEYYENMGLEYQCYYVICNFEDKALEAREAARSGLSWEEVTERFHDGKPSPSGIYKVSVPYGQYSPAFQDKVFATPEGGVTMPIKSNYGYWVLRVENIVQNEKPPFPKVEAQILDTIRNRTIGTARDEERQRIFDEYELKVHDEALWKVFQGLPDQGLMDPATNQPFKRDQLKGLDISPADYGDVLLSYRDEDGSLVEVTISDFKDTFDSMNVFQRPKKDEMLGALRLKVLDEVGKALVNIEARKRGFHDDPKVKERVDLKLEESLISRLYQEVVKYDETVTPEELKAFWDEHSHEYEMPESRTGRVVICRDRKTADKAHAALSGGMAWAELLAAFDCDAKNKSQGGRTGSLSRDSQHPAAETLYAMEEAGQISEPIAYNGNRWAVVQLNLIKPARDYEMTEVSEALGGRIKKARQDEAFSLLLEEWAGEFGVQIYEDKLAGLKSWQELTNPELPDNLVPRP